MSRHLDVFLPSLWSHQPGVKVSGWVQQNRLAALCTELADQIEHSEAHRDHGTTVAMALAGDFEAAARATIAKRREAK